MSREDELQEIADGAWGDNPMVRGAARDALQAEASEPKPPYREWCRNPKLCAGKGYCPRDPNCGD